jgi:hypothetical protein
LEDFKKGRQWDTTTSSLIVNITPQYSVKSVGKIIPIEIIDEIIDDSCGYDNSIRIKFFNSTQTAYETD